MKNVDTGDIVKIVQKYTAYVSSLARKYFIVGGTFDDIFEEGVIGILEACKNYKGESLFDNGFDSFVKVCIKRQIIDAIKKSNTLKNKALNESVSLSQNDSADNVNYAELLFDRNNSGDPLEMFLDKEIVSEMFSFCESNLSDFEKEVLYHYLAGEKQSEIALELNKDVKSIDNTIQRIKNKLSRKKGG